MSSEEARRAADDAADWLLRLESGSMPLREREQFVDWLRESPVHMAEMLRVVRLHGDLAAFSQWEAIEPLAGAGVTTDAPRPTKASILPFPRVPHRRKSSRPWLAAAVVAAVTLVTGAVYFATRLSQTVISTQVGERREITLAEGTEVSVAPESKVRILLGSRERLVVLDRGEAFFHVSRDPQRPFIVDAGQTRTRALGTSFNVERSPNAVVVTVVEGRVAVSPTNNQHSGNAGDFAIPLGADEQVAVAADGKIAAPRTVSAKRETAWLQGQLIFENDTVADVVRRFNSYNHVQVRVLDESVASRPVTGVFRATDPESFVSFLQQIAGVRVEHTGNNQILLQSAAADPMRDPPR